MIDRLKKILKRNIFIKSSKKKTKNMNDIKFEHEEDELFIKVLLRSAKETNVLYSCGQSIKDIYKKCLISRKSHPTESMYTNAMYWSGDCGFYNADIIYKILLISSIDKDKLEKNDIKELRRILGLCFSSITNNKKLFKYIYALDLIGLAAKKFELEIPCLKDANFIIDSLNKYEDVIDKLPL